MNTLANRPRFRRSPEERAEMQRAALDRASSGNSTMNYEPIYAGFTARGIPLDEIQPRENVFTYNAWQALGRQVRKGEHGVRVTTWIITAKEQPDGTTKTNRFPTHSTVFHVSQTDPIQPAN